MKLLDKFKAKDKIGHLKAGAIIGLVGALICAAISINVWFAMLLVIGAAVGKELYDYKNPENHTVEVLDAVSTILGGLIPVLLVFLVNV